MKLSSAQAYFSQVDRYDNIYNIPYSFKDRNIEDRKIDKAGKIDTDRKIDKDGKIDKDRKIDKAGIIDKD